MSSNSPRSRAATRRESLVDMALGNLPWIRRQSTTTGAPATTNSSSTTTAEGVGEKLRKRRESMTAAFPKKSVRISLLFFPLFFFLFCNNPSVVIHPSMRKKHGIAYIHRPVLLFSRYCSLRGIGFQLALLHTNHLKDR